MFTILCRYVMAHYTVVDPWGRRGAMAHPGPVKISHKKEGRQRWLHRFHVSRPPPLNQPLDLPLEPTRDYGYRSGTVNSKSFIGKVLLRIKRKFELTYAL